MKDAYSDEARFDVVNSTELRAYNLKLKEVKLPTPLQVPSRDRRLTRSTAQEAAAYRPDIHLVMDAKTEELIHKQNWAPSDGQHVAAPTVASDDDEQ